MRTGEVEANLLKLNEEFRLNYIEALVQRKLAGPEQSALPEVDMTFHRDEYQRLRAELQREFQTSALPEAPSALAALNELLINVRLARL